jgi:DNA invertase Pin-like site-specific DNA recombinase
MGNLSEPKQPGSQSPPIRAIAYYRQSTQNRQEESLAEQKAQVRQWAAENGVEIIREFFDDCPANIDSDERSAFAEMINDWINQRSDFEYVLCLDASRWGRLQGPTAGQRSCPAAQKAFDLHGGV